VVGRLPVSGAIDLIVVMSDLAVLAGDANKWSFPK
jgi:hypothetical protein